MPRRRRSDTSLSVGFQHLHPEEHIIADDLMRHNLACWIDNLKICGFRIIKFKVDFSFNHFLSLPAKRIVGDKRCAWLIATVGLPRQ